LQMYTECTRKSPKKKGRINSTPLSQKKGALKKRCCLIVVVLILTSANLTVSGLREQPFFGLKPEFHTYSEVVSELFQIESDHSTIASVFLLGESYQNRDILGIKISDNVSTDESEPEAFICALHHAREAATVEVAMYIIHYLTDHYGRPGYEQVTYLVDNREIYIIPIVNVDGKIFDDSSRYYGCGQYWRKNRQTCSGGIGIDLNRNYSYHWAERDASSCCADPSIFRGYEPFDAPETAAIRDFVTAHPDITVFLDYHSYAGLVLWPWGYTEAPISNLGDRQVHEIIGREYAAITGYTPMQVSDLYCCSGISIDWSYGITQYRDVPIFSWTIELWGESYPPATGFYPDPSDIPFLCESNCEAALYVIECADNPYKVLGKWKTSHVSEGEPVDDRGNAWYEAGFDDFQWKSIYLPHLLEPESRKFFRHHFTVYYEAQQVLLDFENGDSITIYVNGQIIQQGKDRTPQKDLKLKNHSPVDITAYVHQGENIIAVQVVNASEFDMNVTQRTDMYDHKEWKAFPGSDCTKPGKSWYTSEYDDSAWDTITLPDELLPRTGDGYYRRTFTVPDYTRVFIDFSDCESMTLYVNEQIAGQWGLSKNQSPVDITAYVHQGENVIAVHISGGQPFDFTIIRPRILPDLCLTDQDIYFSNPCPAPQDEITIYATVHNGAHIAVPSALVRFYSGNPGNRLLIDELSVEVPPASSTTIDIQWVYPGGEHDIYVVIDENNDIPEPEREHNNDGHRSLPSPDFSTWPMFRHDVHHTGMSPLKGTIDDPVEKWRFSTGGPVRSSPAVADINNDGETEIVFGSDDHTLYAVTCEGRVLWSYQTEDCIRSSPAIADINNDGDTEIVFGSDDGNVYVLRGKDGSVVWKYFVNEKIRSSPLVYDLDNNGKMEIIFGSHNFVYTLREDGTLLWTFSTGERSDSSPAVTMEGNRYMVVIGSGDGKLHFVDAESGRKGWYRSTCGKLESSPAIADIDRDGDLEVVIGSSGNSIYAEGSRFFWNTVVEGSIRSSPAIADINGNGTTEVIVGSDEGAVYALNGNNGSLLWSYHTEGSIFSSPAVADIDGDGRCDIVVGSGDTCCYALTGDGRLLWKFPTGGRVESSPAIADIDRDGYAEIVVGSNDGCVYVLDSEGVSKYWIGLLLGILVGFLLLLFLLRKRELYKSAVIYARPCQIKNSHSA